MPWHKAAKLIWAAPCTAIGLVFAVIPLALGGRGAWNRGALEISYRRDHAGCGRLARALPLRGIVFGHVILVVSEEELQRIGPHERVHVEQYERWGPLFFVAYGLSGCWQMLRGRSPYWHNHFEVEARMRAAGAHVKL